MPDEETTEQGTLDKTPVDIEFVDTAATAGTTVANTAVISTITTTATATSTVTVTSELAAVLSEGEFSTDVFRTNTTRVD